MTNKRKTIGVFVDDELSKQIDDFRRKEPDVPASAEAVRRLVRIGLTHRKEADQSASAAP